KVQALFHMKRLGLANLNRYSSNTTCIQIKIKFARNAAWTSTVQLHPLLSVHTKIHKTMRPMSAFRRLVLLLDHPRKRIRDTAKYKPFQEKVKTKRPSLKKLAKEILSLSIQSGEHSSVEDARAAMKLSSHATNERTGKNRGYPILAKNEWSSSVQNSLYLKNSALAGAGFMNRIASCLPVQLMICSKQTKWRKGLKNMPGHELRGLKNMPGHDYALIVSNKQSRLQIQLAKSQKSAFHVRSAGTMDTKLRSHTLLRRDFVVSAQRKTMGTKFAPPYKDTEALREKGCAQLMCDAQAPKLYGLPKIHKENTPMRPIVSFCSSPTYELSKYLARILKPLTERSEHRLVNSADFITKIQAETISATHELVSFDVKFLFTSIPLKLAIECMEESLANYDDELPIQKEEIIDLLKLCLESTFFQYNGSFYQQLHGTAMGSPVSVVVAEIKNDFLDHLNQQNPSLQFTMEPEKDGKIAFLDCMITRDGNSLQASIYRKPTSTSRLLDNSSYHPTSHKSATIATLVKRAHAVCSSSETFEDELQHLDKIFTINRYSKPFVNNGKKQENYDSFHSNQFVKASLSKPQIDQRQAEACPLR
ncbi:Cationic trypsin-3, partial [Paramuricea clavata]